MRQVLRICAVLMGVLLVAMTGVVEVLRASNQPPSTILLVVKADEGSYYALFEPQSRKVIQITPQYYQVTTKGVSPDGRWLYFVETQLAESVGGDNLYGRLRRVALTGHSSADELLLDDINFWYTVWSPDFTWLFYVDYTAYHLFVANPLTGQKYDLTSELPPSQQIHSLRKPEIAFDGDWVMFSAWDDTVDSDTYYRVRLDGTGLEHIGNVDGMSVSFSKPENGHWYIGHKARDYDHLYRIRDDLQEAIVIDSMGDTLRSMEFRYWLSDDIALLQCQNGTLSYNTILAVQMSDGQILWMVDHVVADQYLPDMNWLFFRRYDYTNHQDIQEVISVHGLERREVSRAGGDVMEDVSPMGLFDWKSKSDWWFYTFYNFRMSRFELHRLSADWKTDEALWMDENALALHKWQGKNLIFSSNMGVSRYAVTAFYQLDTDTLQVKRIMQSSLQLWIEDVNGPAIEREFQPIPLLVVGGGLMSILLWGRASNGINSIKGWARRPTLPKW